MSEFVLTIDEINDRSEGTFNWRGKDYTVVIESITWGQVKKVADQFVKVAIAAAGAGNATPALDSVDKIMESVVKVTCDKKPFAINDLPADKVAQILEGVIALNFTSSKTTVYQRLIQQIKSVMQQTKAPNLSLNA